MNILHSCGCPLQNPCCCGAVLKGRPCDLCKACRANPRRKCLVVGAVFDEFLFQHVPVRFRTAARPRVVPRHLRRARLSVLLLWRLRAVVMDAVQLQLEVVEAEEAWVRRRERALMLTCDSRLMDVNATIDTDLLHGTFQRVKVAHLSAMVAPLLEVNHAKIAAAMYVLNTAVTALKDALAFELARVWRGHEARRDMAERRAAAKRVQLAQWSAHQQHLIHTRVARLQALVRGVLTRQHLAHSGYFERQRALRDAVIRIQSVARMYLANRRVAGILEDLHVDFGDAGDRVLPDYAAKPQPPADPVVLARRQENAAATLQRVARGWFGRQEARSRRAAT